MSTVFKGEEVFFKHEHDQNGEASLANTKKEKTHGEASLVSTKKENGEPRQEPEGRPGGPCKPTKRWNNGKMKTGMLESSQSTDKKKAHGEASLASTKKENGEPRQEPKGRPGGPGKPNKPRINGKMETGMP